MQLHKINTAIDCFVSVVHTSQTSTLYVYACNHRYYDSTNVIHHCWVGTKSVANRVSTTVRLKQKFSILQQSSSSRIELKAIKFSINQLEVCQLSFTTLWSTLDRRSIAMYRIVQICKLRHFISATFSKFSALN